MSCLIASFSRGKNFEVMLDIFSVLVFQISVFESYLDICFKISYDQKCENCDNLGLYPTLHGLLKTRWTWGGGLCPLLIRLFLIVEA